MTQTLTHFINGQSVDGTSGRFADVYHPANGQVAARVPLASVEEVKHAVATAKAAQVGWEELNAQRRARILGRFVDLAHENMAELATTLSNEHGKTFADAKGDVQRGLEVIEFCMAARTCSKVSFPTSLEPALILLDASTFGRHGRDLAFQLSCHDPVGGPASLAAGTRSFLNLPNATLPCP